MKSQTVLLGFAILTIWCIRSGDTVCILPSACTAAECLLPANAADPSCTATATTTTTTTTTTAAPTTTAATVTTAAPPSGSPTTAAPPGGTPPGGTPPAGGSGAAAAAARRRLRRRIRRLRIRLNRCHKHGRRERAKLLKLIKDLSVGSGAPNKFIG